MKMNVSVYAIDKTLISVKNAQSVSLPGTLGRFCVYPKHVSMISKLKDGMIEVKYLEGNIEKKKEVSVKSGFFSIKGNEAIAVVSV